MRYHAKPVNCVRCGKVFETRDAKYELEMHTLETCSITNIEGRWDRMMTTIQKSAISKRKDTGGSPQAYWFALFGTLFPHCSPPEHPC
jgi:hypothetical protein